MPSLAGFDNFIKSQSAQPTGLGPTTQSGNFNLDELIATISPQYGIDPEVTRALVKLESGGNPNARPIDPKTGKVLSSAKGLMQLIDATAREMGVQDPFDPAQNLHGGLRYLKQHLDATGGDLDRALRMYNQGPAGPLHEADDYVNKFKKFYGKEFTSASTPVTEKVDIGAALKGVLGEGRQVAQASPSSSMPPLNVAPIVPDTTADLGGTVLGRGVDKAYTLTPENTPQLGKLPFGVENKGSTVEQIVKDIAYGIPEGAASLTSMAIGMVPATAAGLSSFGAAGTPETGAFSDTPPPSMQDTLVTGKERFDKVMEATTMAPQTAMGKYIMRPFEVAIGSIYNTHDEVVRDLNPNATPEELEKKFKAGHFVLDVLGAGAMAKGVFRGKPGEKPAPIKVEDVEAAKAEVLANPEVAPEVKAQVGSVTPDLIQTLQQKVAQSEAKARVEKAGTIPAKAPENQSIVDGLLMEVELREGRAKVTMRKAAQIVADHDGDIALADLKGIKGINPEGSTGKAVKRLVEERDATKKVETPPSVGDDVPMGDDAPIIPVKSIEEVPPKVDEAPPEVPSSEPVPVGGGGVDPIPQMVASIDSNLKYDGKMGGIPEAGIPDIHNLTLTLDDGRQPSFSISGEITPEKIAAEVQKVREKFAPKVEEASVEVPKVAEDLPIPEFDSTSKAKEEGYTFHDKARYASLDRAKAKATELGEGHEVVKVKGKYKVAKYEETPVTEFPDVAAVERAGLELMSEVPAERVQFESPSTGEGFGIAKVGDKYYRTSTKVEMPRKGTIAPVEVPNTVGDGVSLSDYQALLKFTDEEPKGEKGAGFYYEPAKANEVSNSFDSEAEGRIVAQLRSAAKNTPMTFEGRSLSPLQVDIVEDAISTRRRITKERVSFLAQKHNVPENTVRQMASGGPGYEMVAYQRDIGDRDSAVFLRGKAQPPAGENPIGSNGRRSGTTLRELEARDRVKELTPMVKGEGGKPVDPALLAEFQERYKQWKDSYVTKCNIAASTKKGKTPKKPITKESLALVDDNFKTFKNMEDAKEWMESTGAVGELISDPLTGKVSFMNTERLKGLDKIDIWDEGVEQLTGRSERLLNEEVYPDMELSDTGVRDLWSILNNERGSVEVPDARVLIDLVNSTVVKAKKMGKSIDEYLDFIGADQATIDMFKAAMAQVPQMRERLKEEDSITTSIFMPDSKIVNRGKPRLDRNKNVVAVEVPITQKHADMIVNASRDAMFGKTITHKNPETGKEINLYSPNSLERAMNSLTRPLYALKAAGFKDLYNNFRDAASNAARDVKTDVEWLKGLSKEIAKERRENFAISMYENGKSVKEAFESMGIKKSEPLTPREMEIKTELFRYMEKFLDKINYIRVHTGLKPIPKLLDMDGNPNYIPLIRAMGNLADLGFGEGLTTMPLSSITAISKDFKGIVSSYSKQRKVSDMAIELDPFMAIEKYIRTGHSEVHLSPVSALAKRMATAKVKFPDGKSRSLLQHNPALGNLLLNWSDQIIGRDTATAALMAKNGWIGKSLTGPNSIAAKLVAAIIGGSLRTVMVQPSAYLTSVFSNFGNPYYAIHGITRLIGEKLSDGMSRYQRESSMASLREAPTELLDMVDYIQRGLITGTRAKLTDISLRPMAVMDRLVAEMTWNAAVRYGEKALKMEGKDAVKFADEFVEKAQGLSHKGAVSPLESTAATKWMTTLQSFGIAEFNFIARNILGIKNPSVRNKATVARVVRYGIAMAITGQIYKWLGLDNVVPDPLGEYERAKEGGASNPRALLAASSEVLEKIPLIGSAIKYGSSPMGPIPDAVKIMTYDAAKSVADLTDWGGLTPYERKKTITNIVKAVGYAYGIPGTHQIIKSVNAYYKGGNPWEVILGVYEEEKKRKGGLRPEIPRPPQPPRPF